MKSRQREILLWSTVFILLLVGYQFIPFETTSRDLDIAKDVVGTRTSQPVLSAKVQGHNTIIVTTGWTEGSLSGDGDDFYLRKILWHWWIFQREHWAA